MSKEKKPPKIKIAKLFSKKYDDKQYNKKILKKLFVPADRKLIESLFTTVEDPKKGTLHTIDASLVKDKAQAKKLATIAKQIKKQKGRFNIVSIVLAIAIVTAIVLVLTVFRNVIARVAVTNAVENSFGAKCDIADIDCNLLDASFRIDGLQVANRSSPMKNLFGVGRLDLEFDLLELSRGKIVADNLEITDVTWNTDRKTSGALPPERLKKIDKKKAGEKPNPVTAALKAEVDKVKSGVSVGSGIDAVKDQLDPMKYLEKEKAALLSPAIVEKITQTVPGLVDKWETKNKEVRSQVDKTLSDGKKVASLNVSSIKTVKEAQSAIEEIKSASETVKSSLALAQATATEASSDTKSVKALASEAEAAIKADSARLKALADTVKGFNLETGKGMVSGVFRTFVINTLGAYYPYLDRGVTMLKNMQNSQAKNAEKKMSLKKKANAIERLPGRNVSFGSDSMPRLLLKNIELSAKDGASGISGSGTVQNVTDDADRVNKPISVALGVKHGKMSETVDGIVDLRSASTETVNTKFVASGYTVAIDSAGISGVPSVNGEMKAGGNLVIARDGTVTIGSDLLVSNAKIAVGKFEPDFVYNAYQNVLASVSRIDLDVQAVISPSGDIDLAVNTDLDQVIAQALKDEMKAQIEKVKAGIRREADKYIAEQKAKYSSEIARFTDVSAKAQKALDDMKNYEKLLADKRAEAEQRVKDIAKEEAAEKLAPATEAATKAAEKVIPNAPLPKPKLKGLLP